MKPVNVIIKKYFNATGIGLSWIISSLTKRQILWGMPFSAGVELTNRCNLNCPECAAGSGILTRPSGFMDDGLFNQVVSQLGDFMINTMFYFQGESMLHPRFFDFLEKAKGMGVIISTNGHFIGRENVRDLVGSGARRIIVSLDGISKDSYTAYRRGGDLEKVKEAVLLLGREAGASRGSPEIVVQVLVNRYNEAEINEIILFAARAKARLSLKSMQLLNPGSGDSILPANQAYRRYIAQGDSARLKGRLSNRCLRLWTNPVITWDGRVVPCCFDKDATYEMGNLYESTFREIWNGKKYGIFRENLLSDRRGIQICSNCTSGVSREVRV